MNNPPSPRAAPPHLLHLTVCLNKQLQPKFDQLWTKGPQVFLRSECGSVSTVSCHSFVIAMVVFFLVIEVEV